MAEMLGCGKSKADEEMRDLSCYKAPPKRTLELYEEARAKCPVAHSDEHEGFHVLLSYSDVKRAMGNHELYSSEPQAQRPLLPRKPVPGLDMDPPTHGHWRVLYNQAVTAKTAEMLEPSVRADITERIDGFIESGHAEIVEDLCHTVPADAVCHLVGVDDELVPTVREKAIATNVAMGDLDEYARALADFGDLVVGEIDKRRSDPRDDYLTYLATVEVEGRPLDYDDYVGLLLAFLVAGHHTTTSAMSSLVYEVFRSGSGVRDQLIADPDAIPTAVEENLRLHPPLYGFFRRTTADTEVEGIEIPEGHDVYMTWVAANRDPEAFPEPLDFSLDRGRNRHLTFGFGIHTCPGASLARMEMRVLLEELLRRVPDLKVEIDEPHYEFGGGEYAYMVELPVSFTPGAKEGVAA